MKAKVIISMFVIAAFLAGLGNVLNENIKEGKAGGNAPFDYQNHPPIAIDSRDDWLKPESGITQGNGTKTDPYVIEGWDISGIIRISDVTEYCIIRNVKAEGILIGTGGGFCGDTQNIEIRNVEIKGSQFSGINLQMCSNILITNSTIVDCSVGIESWGTNIEIKNNKIENCEQGIVATVGPVDIINNKILNCQREGILLEWGPDIDVWWGEYLANIGNNIIRACKNGIEIDSDESAEATFDHNTLTDIENAAIEFVLNYTGYGFDGTYPLVKYSVNYNDISDCGTGINYHERSLCDPDLLSYTPAINLHYNNIYSNEVGARFDSARIIVNATKNWWGHETGPSGEGPGYGNSMIDIYSDVMYDPWLTNPCKEAGVEDKTPPDVEITFYPEGTIYNCDATFKWTGNDDITPTNQLVYSYKLEGYDSSWSSWTSSTSKTYSNLKDGSYTFKVKAKDKAGNVDSTPAEKTFTLITDNNPPATTITGSPQDTINYNTNITFRWTGNDDITPTNQLVYSYKLEGYDSSWSSWTSSTSKTYSNLKDGSYTFKVKAKDKAGNVDSTPAEKTFKISKKDNGGIPGFELIAFIAAVVAVAWVKRRKK